MLRVSVSTILNAPLEQVWLKIKRTDTLIYVTRGVLDYSDCVFPSELSEGDTITMQLWLFHFLPLWRHRITILQIDDAQHILHTNESGGLIRVWNHTLSASQQDSGKTFYQDQIDVDAGLFSPLIWLFANLFYRYRQYRWHSWARFD